MKKFNFLHITKTGCTSLIDYFLKHYRQYLCRCPDDYPHEITSSDIPKECLVVVCVRDPLDRFISAYNYYMYGSEMYNEQNYFYRESDINLFIKNILPSILQTEIKTILESKKIDYIWNKHFYPQSFWLNKEDFNRTIIIKYTNCLSLKIKPLCNILNIPYIDSIDGVLQHKNITSKKSKNINKLTYDFIKTQYSIDYDLFQTIDNYPNKFYRII